MQLAQTIYDRMRRVVAAPWRSLCEEPATHGLHGMQVVDALVEGPVRKQPRLTRTSSAPSVLAAQSPRVAIGCD